MIALDTITREQTKICIMLKTLLILNRRYSLIIVLKI
jgi:hypothetical protein